jgi:hypothetical protein
MLEGVDGATLLKVLKDHVISKWYRTYGHVTIY